MMNRSMRFTAFALLLGTASWSFADFSPWDQPGENFSGATEHEAHAADNPLGMAIGVRDTPNRQAGATREKATNTQSRCSAGMGCHGATQCQ